MEALRGYCCQRQSLCGEGPVVFGGGYSKLQSAVNTLHLPGAPVSASKTEV